MRRGHEEMLRLCDALESVADALPANLDQLHCLALAESLEPLVDVCQRYEEHCVFPCYLEASGRQDVVDRLRREHIEDAGAAHELAEVLREVGKGNGIENCEALGYMLRAFFGAVRRHVAFEHDHVRPLIGTNLGSG